MTGHPSVRVPRSEWIILAVLTATVVSVRGLIGYLDIGATVWGDETLYLELARSVARLDPVTTVHYPPLYPALVSAGLVAGEWFPAVMAISAAISGLVVPAAHLLARSLGMRNRLAVAALAGVLPAGWVYTQFLMSENLSTPLAVLATALAVRGRRREGFVVGLLVAGLYLTKYLLLPMALVLAVTWLVLVRHRHRSTGARGLDRGAVAWVATGAALPLVLWAVAATSAGFPLSWALGARLPRNTLSQAAERGSLSQALLWVAIYAGIVLLVALPVWPAVIGHLARAGRDRSPDPQRAYLLVVPVLEIGYVAVAAQHSLGAPYNADGVVRIMGRYLLHLTPLLLVLGLLLAEKVLSRPRPAVRWSVVAVGSAGVLVVAAAVWRVFYRGWLLDLPAESFTRALTAGDLFPMRSGWFLLLVLAVTAVTAALVAVARDPRWSTPLAWLWVAAYATAPVTWLAQAEAFAQQAPAAATQGGTVDRKLYGLLADLPGERFVVVLDQGLRTGNVRWASMFWEVDPARVEVHRSPDDLELAPLPPDGDAAGALRQTALDLGCDGVEVVCVVVRRDELDLEPLLVDDRWGQTVRFYPMDGPFSPERSDGLG